MQIFKHTNFDFLRWRWHAIALSWVIIIAGMVTIAMKGIPRGVEFAGGTVVIEEFDDPSVNVQRVREALDRNYTGGGQNTLVQSYGDPSSRQFMIRVPQVGAESGAALGKEGQAVEEALKKANLSPRRVGGQIVGATVGRELESKGLWATALSLVGILAYLAFRFQLSFGVGAVVATIHDLLITFAFLAFFQYDLTLNVIAALLTMTGYSTNDTIVIFDRVRENLRSMRRDSLPDVINRSVNQTLSRTIITSGTALLTALALFFFGGEVLRGFAFTMVVGIITGTYSSVFIAAAIVSLWRGTAPTRAGAHAPAPSTPPTVPSRRVRPEAATTSAPQQPSRRVKPQRKARAS
jgi:preprotein translocase subunit SecF